MKIINHSISIYLITFSLIFIVACGHDHSDHEGHDHGSHEGHDHGGHAHHQPKKHADGKIHLTAEQVKTMSIKFGDFSNMKINDFVQVTGTLGLPPNAMTSVNPKANGFIRNCTKYVEGAYIRKGDIMAYLENIEFIQYQQKYLEISAALVFDQQELNRHKTLVEANAGAEKNVQRLRAEINVKTATLKGIAKQLEYIGINTANLTTENIIQQVPLYAPTSGYVASVNLHNGKYVTPQLELLEIISESHLHLELDVFEQDIANIKKEQRITYTIPALGGKIYKGSVYVIGKAFNSENKTVRIHGHLSKKQPRFIKDLFIEGKIWLNNHTVQALPEKAIVKDGATSYIYATKDKTKNNEFIFDQLRVIEGTSDNGFTSIKLIDKIPANMKIVTDGAYYVYAQSKAGELEHVH